MYNYVMYLNFLFHNIIYAAVLSVEFNTTEYTVNEQETGVFLLGLSTSADRNVSVVLTTSDQSANS